MVNIAEPLSSIFICLSYLCYLSSVSHTTTLLSPSKVASPSILSHIFTTIGFVVFLTISCLYKETAITLIGIVIGTSIIIVFSHFISKYQSSGFSLFLHLHWIGVCLGSFILYFLFRKLLVASPYELQIFCPYLPQSISSLFIDSCSRYSLRGSTITPLLVLARDTLTMLFSLFSTPLRGVLPILSSSNSSHSSSSTYSSFYLDQSQLIRRAENPFAFLDNTTEKIFSFSYLHFRYMYLLLYPQDLCAEYAFNCIPKVSTWEDDGRYRARFPLLVYVALLFIGFYGLHCVWRHTRGQQQLSSKDKKVMNIHLLDTFHPLGILISLMFLVIPFIPASGVRSLTLVSPS